MHSLDTLLDQARAALIAGDLPRLDHLVQEMMASPPPADAALLARIGAKARRNAVLLDAAMKGVRAARRRLDDLSRRDRFATYDAQGRRGEVGAQPTGTSRRL